MIDQWQAKLMKGLSFVIELVDCLVPKADEAGPRKGPAFLEVGEGQCADRKQVAGHITQRVEAAKAEAMSLIQTMSTEGASDSLSVKDGMTAVLHATTSAMGRATAEEGGGGGGGGGDGDGGGASSHQAKLVPGMKKSLYNALVHPTGASVTNLINYRLSKPLQQRLHGQLMTSLRDTLNSSIAHGILHSTGNAVPLIVSKTVPQMMDKLIPSFVFHSLTQALTGTLTRSLVHSLTPALVSTLGMSPQEQYWCYHCHTRREHCAKCHRHASTEIHVSMFYANFYADYYSDYYADYFVKNAFSLLNGS